MTRLRRPPLRRALPLILLLLASAQGCSGWKNVPLHEAVPAERVRVRTYRGETTVLERPAVEGDSVLVGVPEGAEEPVRIPLGDIMALGARGHSWSGTATVVWFALAAASMGMVLLHYLGT